MAIFKFEFRDKVRDEVSGFEGLVTARYQFMNGCIRYAVSPTKLNDKGMPYEDKVFDEQQLTLKKAANPPRTTTKHPGGPRDTSAARMPDPKF
jgi:hypothetical protein